MRSVHKDLQFLIFLVFNKNEALKGLLGITLPYNQLNICVLATLCAIFMPLASKLWCSQWFEVGQSAMAKSIFGPIWLFDHERSPVELSDSYAILLSIQKCIVWHVFRAIEAYLRIVEFLADLRQHDNHPKSEIFTKYSKNVSYNVFFDAQQHWIAVWKLYRASFMVKNPKLSKNRFCHCWLAHFKPLWVPQLWCQGHENRT